MAFPWTIREISGNLPRSSGNFRKQQNLREFSGNFGHSRFKCGFWEVFSYVLPSISKPPLCMEAYIYFQYTKRHQIFFQDILWCTLYSQIRTTVWKCVSVPCLLSLQLSFWYLNCILFYNVQIFSFGFFTEVKLWCNKTFCFMTIWWNFSGIGLLKIGLWVGAMLGIFVTKWWHQSQALIKFCAVFVRAVCRSVWSIRYVYRCILIDFRYSIWYLHVTVTKTNLCFRGILLQNT